MLFAKATCQQSREIVNILHRYGAASGQQVNFGKSELSFSKNVSEDLREEIQGILEVVEVKKHERYLGLPTMIGRSKKVVFAQIKEKVWNKLKSWMGKSLSKAGKEVLIKSVLQSIPMYTMSCYFLTSDLCREIEQMMCKFWWGSVELSSIHWIRWSKLCEPKEEGGLGFRDMEAFNLALLAKQGWRIIQDPSSLLAKMLKARYFPNTSFLEASIGYSPSYARRSILRGREYLLKGLYWSIGNGSTVGVKSDPWLPRPSYFKPIICDTSLDDGTKVIDLIDWNSSSWREDLLNRYFLPCDVEQIMKIRLIHPEIQDELTWHYEKSGIFTVKSCYWVAYEHLKEAGLSAGSSSAGAECTLWKQIWKLRVPPRVRSFIWRCSRGILPCKLNLFRRRCVEDPLCVSCGREETMEHVLFHCVRARRVWTIMQGRAFSWFSTTNFSMALEQAFGSIEREELECWIMVMYGIWYARNCLIFKGTVKDDFDIMDEQLRLLQDFKAVSGRRYAATTAPTERVQRWSRPDEGFVKINCDGSSSEVGCGIGFIARDHNGVACFLGARTIQAGAAPEIAEAEAILAAVQSAVEMELSHVVIESDCLVIVNLLQKGVILRGTMGSLIQRIRQEATGVEVLRWSFVRRHGNAAAHLLATSRPPAPLFSLCLQSLSFDLNSVLLDDIS